MFTDPKETRPKKVDYAKVAREQLVERLNKAGAVDHRLASLWMKFKVRLDLLLADPETEPGVLISAGRLLVEVIKVGGSDLLVDRLEAVDSRSVTVKSLLGEVEAGKARSVGGVPPLTEAELDAEWRRENEGRTN